MVEHDAKSSPVPRCGHTRGELRAINEGVRAVKTTRDYLGWSGASTPDAAGVSGGAVGVAKRHCGMFAFTCMASMVMSIRCRKLPILVEQAILTDPMPR